MKTLRSISPGGLLYDHIIATGGIGSGIFFSLKGNETLGREESRMGTLLPYRDYCKQHIILHYMSVLLGAGGGNFESYPIGKVGNDETGRELLKQMDKAGMNTEHVMVSNENATLFSVCFQYPDHAGGNITTAESASNELTPAQIDNFFDKFTPGGSREYILAVPEVPVESRIQLFEHGRKRGSLNVSSVLTSEMDLFKQMNGFELTDMLFINLNEASALANLEYSVAAAETIILASIRNLLTINENLTVFITCGAAGVYAYSKKRLEFFPAFNVDVVSTAGAGDAFLAGMLAGISCGLPIFKKNKEQASMLTTATELGILLAAVSVCSPHTIHPEVNSEYLEAFIKDKDLKYDESFIKIFG